MTHFSGDIDLTRPWYKHITIKCTFDEIEFGKHTEKVYVHCKNIQAEQNALFHKYKKENMAILNKLQHNMVQYIYIEKAQQVVLTESNWCILLYIIQHRCIFMYIYIHLYIYIILTHSTTTNWRINTAFSNLNNNFLCKSILLTWYFPMSNFRYHVGNLTKSNKKKEKTYKYTKLKN